MSEPKEFEFEFNKIFESPCWSYEKFDLQTGKWISKIAV